MQPVHKASLAAEVISVSPDHPVNDRGMKGFDVALGSLALGASAVRRAAITCEDVLGPAMNAALRPPLVNPRLHPERLLRDLSERGRAQRAATVQHAKALARDLVPPIAAAVLDELDLTAIVLDRVDLDAIAARLDLNRIAENIDVDRVAERVDLEAILDRLDIVALALWIIDGIDLPGIIRESTSSVASEAMRSLRMQSIEADQVVSRVVDRILMRRRARADEPSGNPTPATEPVAQDGAQQP